MSPQVLPLLSAKTSSEPKNPQIASVGSRESKTGASSSAEDEGKGENSKEEEVHGSKWREGKEEHAEEERKVGSEEKAHSVQRSSSVERAEGQCDNTALPEVLGKGSFAGAGLKSESSEFSIVG